MFPAGNFDLTHTRIMNGSIANWPLLSQWSFEYVSLASTNILLCLSIVTDVRATPANLAGGWNVKNWL